TKLSLKLLVDSKANKVLFAEAGKDFVDFLFHILSLPVGTVVKLLNVKGMVGSIGSLYKSVESLSSEYFQADVDKDVVLKPKAAVNVPLLELDDGPADNMFYRCYSHYQYVSHDPNAICPSCRSKMSTVVTYVPPQNAVNIGTTSDATGGYVKGVVTYMVMDNLEVKPMSTILGITLINKFHVRDVSALIEKEVEVGFTEGLAMLKASFEVSNKVLTTVFLSKKAYKANKVLFAEAGKEFVDFLLHILSLPVGTVVKLLNVNGMVGSIGSLYKSVESLSSDYFQANLDKDAVLKPKTAVNVPLLELNEGPNSNIIYRCGSHTQYVSHDPNAICPSCGRNISSEITYVPAKNAVDIATTSDTVGGYVKGVVTYMIMDNLEVKPMSTISGITLMNKFSVQDVTALVEKEVQVGLTEGLAMLKASFEVANTVLTTVFLSKKAE
ncbi:hypothetical protein KSS87_020682, partial [Heliosperma pusillum]